MTVTHNLSHNLKWWLPPTAAHHGNSRICMNISMAFSTLGIFAQVGWLLLALLCLSPVSAQKMNRPKADVMVIPQGRYLVYPDGSRFFMKGMAFPIQIPFVEKGYDKDGWIAVLEQLAATSTVNTLRIYTMDCREDYTEFIMRAQELGFYLIVPLTYPEGEGVLDRNLAAPKCYNAALYQYGKKCVNNFGKFVNVLAGMIGNEVMSDLEYWPSAPCVTAYARDLKHYMAFVGVRSLALMYAAQDAAIGAVMLPEDTLRLTVDYLSCDADYSIDMFGINVEAWCSSLQTFEKDEKGVESPYHTMWTALHNTSIPIIFSEMGCSKELFNRENGLQRYVRDWKQVPVVLGPMSDVWSGFVAYAYDGDPLFRMMAGSKFWNGKDILPPGPDFQNFVKQLLKWDAAQEGVKTQMPATPKRESCYNVEAEFKAYTNLELFPMHEVPTWFRPDDPFVLDARTSTGLFGS
eukprot:g52061.t1